jgi:hypothetical protein
MSVIRLFESEDAIRAALHEFDEAEISRDIVRVISPADPDAAAAVDASIQAGFLRKAYRRYALSGLERGRLVVVAKPDWTYAGQVEDIFDAAGAVDQDAIPEILVHTPAPFSDVLGIPVLIDSKPRAGLLKFDIESSFGLKLLSDNPTPLSSLLRLPVLKQQTGSLARGSAVEKMSGTPAPFSSRLGLPLLSKGKSSARGSAVERLSGNAAPFSNFLRLPVLTRRR